MDEEEGSKMEMEEDNVIILAVSSSTLKGLEEHLGNLDRVEEALQCDKNNEDLQTLKTDIMGLICLLSKRLITTGEKRDATTGASCSMTNDSNENGQIATAATVKHEVTQQVPMNFVPPTPGSSISVLGGPAPIPTHPPSTSKYEAPPATSSGWNSPNIWLQPPESWWLQPTNSVQFSSMEQRIPLQTSAIRKICTPATTNSKSAVAVKMQLSPKTTTTTHEKIVIPVKVRNSDPSGKISQFVKFVKPEDAATIPNLPESFYTSCKSLEHSIFMTNGEVTVEKSATPAPKSTVVSENQKEDMQGKLEAIDSSVFTDVCPSYIS